MTILRPAEVDGRIFIWHGPNGYAELSDLGPNFRFGRVYDDACDEGLTVGSPSGRARVFAVDQRHYDREGDLERIDLISVGPGEPLKLVLFND